MREYTEKRREGKALAYFLFAIRFGIETTF